MSKGPGKLQNLVVSEIHDSGGSISENSLIWKLAEREDKITISHTEGSLRFGFIESSFLKSINRAIISLSEEEGIIREKRKLLNIDELITYYPFKTTKLEILGLRQTLLPALKDYILKEHLAKYRLYQIEEFIIDKFISSNKELFEEAVLDWRKIEAILINMLIKAPIIERDFLILILIRGYQLIIDRNRSLEYKRPFSFLIDKIHDILRESIKEDKLLLAKTLKEFYSKYFKQTDINHIGMKSQLHEVVYFTGSPPSLKEKAKKELYTRCRPYVKGLPGHKEPEEKVGKMVQYATHVEPTYSPFLNKLVDKQAFFPFYFLSLRDDFST